MIQRPRTKAHLDVYSVDDDKLFVVDGTRQFVLEGRTAARVGTLLDGTRDLGDIVADAGGTLPIPEVLRTIGTMEGLGCVTDGPVVGPREQTAWWDALGADPEHGARALSTPVQLHVVGNVPAAVRGALEAAGLTFADEAELALVVTDDYLDPALAELNASLHATRTPWLLARPTGTEIWIGPYVQPGTTACWTCLAERLEGNRQLARYLAAKQDGDATRIVPASTAMIAPSVAAAAGLVATQLARVLADVDGTHLANTIHTLDLATFEAEHHHVVRQPACTTCGTPTLVTERPARVDLRPQPKRHTSAGGHRVVSPEETLERLQRHVSPISGAVSSLKPHHKVDNGITYSYSSGHNFAMMKDDLYFLRKNLRGRSGGKGRTDIQAKVGSICEAIERFNGVWRDELPTVHASRSDLGDSAVDIEQLLHYSERQYADRHRWNHSQPSSYHLVPNPLDPGVRMHWTRCWSLTNEREVLVPSAYAWFGHPDMLDHWCCPSDANGNAAGNTVEEAALQGLMELVERDAVALWWYNRAPRPGVDLDSVDDPYVDTVREYYAELGRSLWVLDLTSDLGIPVYAAVSHRLEGPTQDILLGFGAHLDPLTAILRALTELNQFLPAVIDTFADGSTVYTMDDPDAVDWWRTATLDSDPYVLPHPTLPMARLTDHARLDTEDLAEDVRRVVARLDERGIETIVLDQTRPDIELATVKMMAPGLRHFWRRLGPGRLFEVPTNLGWLDAPVAEQDLNPRSIFF